NSLECSNLECSSRECSNRECNNRECNSRSNQRNCSAVNSRCRNSRCPSNRYPLVSSPRHSSVNNRRCNHRSSRYSALGSRPGRVHSVRSAAAQARLLPRAALSVSLRIVMKLPSWCITNGRSTVSGNSSRFSAWAARKGYVPSGPGGTCRYSPVRYPGRVSKASPLHSQRQFRVRLRPRHLVRSRVRHLSGLQCLSGLLQDHSRVNSHLASETLPLYPANLRRVSAHELLDDSVSSRPACREHSLESSAVEHHQSGNVG